MADRRDIFVSAIVAAGGSGVRMGQDTEKAFTEVNGLPIVFYSLAALQECDAVSETVLVSTECGEELFRSLGGADRFPRLVKVVRGGLYRQQSVYNGLCACDPRADVIVIHDAARPLLKKEWVTSAIEALDGHSGVVLSAKVTDTLKRATPDGVVQATVPRDELYAVQTPQVFRADWIRRAHDEALSKGVVATDDAALVEAIGGKIRLLTVGRWNLKVTYQEDLKVAAALLKEEA